MSDEQRHPEMFRELSDHSPADDGSSVDEPGHRRRPTPFAPTVGDSEPEVSIDTPPVRGALRLLEEYLQVRRGDGRVMALGNVVTITGEHGTGKTHVAARVIARARAVDREGPQAGFRGVASVYMDLSTLGVHQLYSRFVDGLSRDEVVACVRDYHARLVFDLINDPDLAEHAARFLRKPGVFLADWDAFVSRLGLSKTMLMDRLRLTLVDVVGDEDYAAAFVFLLREKLDDAAWEWIRGAEPAPVLRERGLASAVTGDLSAIGVFARLYGGQDRRLVLVLDELDEATIVSDQYGSVLAFRTLLDQMRSAGSLVFLVGPPELFETFELDLARQIGFRIRTMPFDVVTTKKLIRANLVGTLEPFTNDAVEQIVGLTGGNPRRIGVFCRRLHRIAVESGGQVSADVVLREAKEHFAVTNRPLVAAAIRRVLENQHWDFTRDYAVTTAQAGRVDFWVPVPGTEPAACAIIIVDAVVDDDDVAALVARSEELDRAAIACRPVVVLSSAVNDRFTTRIRETFGREPLTYVAPSFEEDLVVAVKAAMHALDHTGGSDLAGVLNRIEWIGRQQLRTQDTLADLAKAVSTLRTDMNVPMGVHTDPRARDRGPWLGSGTDLPNTVRLLFEQAQRHIDEFGSASAATDQIFNTSVGTDEKAFERIRQIVHPSAGPLLQALGLVGLLQAVIARFREAVERWFGNVARPAHEPLREPERQELDVICRRYEEVNERIRVRELEGLRTFPRSGGWRESPEAWEDRIEAVQLRLGSLASEVRDAALDQFSR